MKRFTLFAIVMAIGSAACGSSSTAPSAVIPTFTAELKPANENPPISNAEQSGSGTATVTFNVTRDASGNVTGGTATFIVNLTGFPAGTPINIAHIHQAPAGTNGGIVFSTSLAAGEVNLANGSGGFTKSNIAPPDPTIIQAIMNNPAGFYFNVHSTLNPGGVARGQLLRIQ
jgi:hypothetical protein